MFVCLSQCLSAWITEKAVDEFLWTCKSRWDFDFGWDLHAEKFFLWSSLPTSTTVAYQTGSSSGISYRPRRVIRHSLTVQGSSVIHSLLTRQSFVLRSAFCQFLIVFHSFNKVQSEMADFAFSAATWRTGWNYSLSLILACSVCYMKTWLYPQNRTYQKYCIAVRGGPSHGRR